MKKQLAVFIYILCGVFGLSGSAGAETAGVYCPAPYDISETPASTLSRLSGSNFLASKAAEHILKSKISEKADGKFKVGVKSFSVSDLKAGRFKSLEIHGENVRAEGVHFSLLDMETLCDFNYITYDEKTSGAVFREDFPMSFSVTLSEDDINNTMQANGYSGLIGKVNSFGKSMSLFEVKSTHAKIKNNKFIYIFNVDIPLLSSAFRSNSGFEVALITDLRVEDGAVILDNPQVMNSYVKIDLNKLTKVFNYLNPLEYSLNVLENKKADLKVRNVNIINDKINITGIINVPKDVLTQK